MKIRPGYPLIRKRLLRWLSFCGLTFLLSLKAYGQNSPSKYYPLQEFIKFWGLLKYNHPAITEGKIDWDAVFISNVNAAKQAKSEAEFTALFTKLMHQCDSVKSPKATKSKLHDDIITLNPVTYHFYGVDTVLSAKLEQLISSPKPRQHYLERRWIDGILTPLHETDPAQAAPPSKEMQLLALARFWNYMNYFYPYKTSLQANWNNILTQYAEKIDACAGYDYYLIMLALTSEISDTHFQFRNAIKDSLLGDYFSPFFTSILKDTVVVRWIDTTNNDVKHKLKVGDVVLKIDGVAVDSLLTEFRKNVKAANTTAVNRNINYRLFRGHTDSIYLTVARNSDTFNFPITRNKGYSHAHNYGYYPSPDSIVYRVNDTTLFIRVYEATGEQIKNALKKNESVTKIIIDLRIQTRATDGYKTLLKYVNREKVVHGKIHFPLWDKPGDFAPDILYNQPSRKARKTPFHLVVIVDEYTQSSGEYLCARFQCIPNSETVGTQTAGALGGVIQIRLPGKIKVLFTSAAYSYPNGDSIYPNGVKIDHVVNRTVEGIRSGKDELLLRAIEE